MEGRLRVLTPARENSRNAEYRTGELLRWLDFNPNAVRKFTEASKDREVKELSAGERKGETFLCQKSQLLPVSCASLPSVIQLRLSSSIPAGLVTGAPGAALSRHW